MTKNEFIMQYYTLEELWKRHLEAKDEEESKQTYRNCEELWWELCDKSERFYSDFEGAVHLKDMLLGLINNPNFFDLYHEYYNTFSEIYDFVGEELGYGLAGMTCDYDLSLKDKAKRIAICIEHIWDKKTEDGKKFFRYNYQWQGIYQAITESKLLPIKNAAEFRDLCLDPTHWLHFLPNKHSSFEDGDPRKFMYNEYTKLKKDGTKQKKISGTYCELSESRPENSEASTLIKETKEELARALAWIKS